MTSIRIATVTKDRAREIIQHVTGRAPMSVEVEPHPHKLVSWVFRELSNDGKHCHIFEGDGSTARDYWYEALQEVCWQNGCLEAIDPTAPVTRDDDNPTAPVWRVCSRHGFKGRVMYFDRP